ncbi:MAG: trypsin-like peptidase domain-containing protein [Alphaproteobacteria bacterium]|nr:trypsin-like peptidase domain-containing protein [Alphaproteobacteria bacterium]
MRKNISLTLLSSMILLSACSKESPELIPCMCDSNADSTLGIFDCMCEPSKKKPVRRISYLQDKQKVRYQSLIITDEQYDAYTLLHQSRDKYAPIALENVDFRIKKSRKYDDFNTKLGDYHFRIFGCRRETKNAFLNQGRSMQKDMHFFDVFYETLNDYYPVVVSPSNVYYPDSDKIPQAEYVITAEITDYFMNICDEFDWNESKNKKLRNGSSEMTVVWRIMNIAKDQVYCRGTTTGYGQVMEGEPNGETLLVERAFEDALTKLPEISCVNSTLSQRVCQADIEAQLNRLNNYENCPTCFKSQYANELRGIEVLQECERNNDTIEMTNITEVELVPVATPVSCEGSACQSLAGIVETSGGVNDANISLVDECQTAEIIDTCADGIEECHTIIEPETPITVADDFFVDIPLEVEQPIKLDIEEDGGATGTGNSTNVEINEIAENSFASVNNQFCIVNNPPFENLNPHNLYKLRASIVSVENASGQKGAGLIIANNLVLTSADLIQKDNNRYKLKTVNGKEFDASAFRINPTKNVAALLLDKPTTYQPLPMSLTLPEVEKDILLTLGLLNFEDEGENYIDNEGRVVGYRWSEDRGAEIIVDTFVQTVTLGGALIDQKGNIIGIAHETKKSDTSPDLFIPIETALKSLGLEICGQKPTINKPKAVRIYTPIADAIDASPKDKSPKPMEGKKRK